MGVRSSALRTAAAWLLALGCIVVLIAHARSMGPGSTVGRWLGARWHGHAHSDRLCVYRAPDGMFHAEWPIHSHRDRDTIFGVDSHYACATIAGSRWRHGFYGPTREFREARMIIGFDPRVALPNELGVRDAACRLLQRDYPNNPRAWALAQLTVGDVVERRVVLTGYVHNAVAVLLVTPPTIMIVRCGRAVRRAWVARQRTRRGACCACAYDLSGIRGDVCPECGTPAQRETPADGRGR